MCAPAPCFILAPPLSGTHFFPACSPHPSPPAEITTRPCQLFSCTHSLPNCLAIPPPLGPLFANQSAILTTWPFPRCEPPVLLLRRLRAPAQPPVLCLVNMPCPARPPCRHTAIDLPPRQHRHPLLTAFPQRIHCTLPRMCSKPAPVCELPIVAPLPRRSRRPELCSTTAPCRPTLFFSHSTAVFHHIPPVNSCVALISEHPYPPPAHESHAPRN